MRLLDLRLSDSRRLRAVFEFSRPNKFEVALSVTLNSEGSDDAFAVIAKIIEDVRHCSDYEHCPECNWSQLMTIIRRCREEAQMASRSAAITISIEDRVLDVAKAQEIFLEKSFSRAQAAVH